jgi:hypothetical protein
MSGNVNKLRVFHVWDGAPDLLEDERDGALLVAHDLREAIALWIRLVPSDVDATSPRGQEVSWDPLYRPGVPAPTLPSAPCVWNPKLFRGFGLFEVDDPTCLDCGDRCDPDDFDRDEELCVHCRGER